MLVDMRPHAYINGKVRPMDEECTLAEAVLVQGDRIQLVGSTDEVLQSAGPHVRITDLKGKALFPGFIDTHSHLSFFSMWSAQAAYCGEDAGSLEGVLERLRAHAENTDPKIGVFGYGFDDSIFTDNRGPSRKELDAVCKDRPVLLLHISAHLCYCNTKALELVEIDKNTHIPGGEVVLDTSGELSGLLLETACFKALELFPSASYENLYNCLQQGMAVYNAAGFTGTHEAGVGFGGIATATYLKVLTELEQAGELNIRTYLSFLPADFEKLADAGIPQGFGGDMIRLSGPKYFADGSIQGYTAALRQPYYNRPDLQPKLILSVEELTEAATDCHRRGYQFTCHGNGDAAIEAIITAIEKAQAAYPREDARHIMVHCQTASEEQLERMRDAGILPTFFGLHVWYYGDRHRELFLGPERAERLDPSGSAVRLGMKHSQHCDSPVMPPWTIRSISTAVTRKTRSGFVLGEDQKISQVEAVRAFTTHAAYFHFSEHERGSIESGKLADFVVLSQDIIACDPEEIINTDVLMTVCGGRVVHGSIS